MSKVPTKSPPIGNDFTLGPKERQKIMALWFFAHRRATSRADEFLASLGLNRTHFRVLFFVGRMPGITVGKLIDILGLTQQAVSKALSRLITDGLIQQESGVKDRRRRHLALSKSGKELENKVVNLQAEIIESAVTKSGRANYDSFVATMSALTSDADTILLELMFDS